MKFRTRTTLAAWMAMGLTAAGTTTMATASTPEGGFIAVLDDDRNNSNSSKSLVFYDVDDMSSPLFAIFSGWKNADGRTVFGSTLVTGDSRSFTGMTVDPSNGDTYVLSIDRDDDAGVAQPEDQFDIDYGVPQNTEGDYDLLKFDFQTAYSDWVTNQGMQYVTYVPAAPNVPGDGQFYSDGTPNANEVILDGLVTKVGEIARPAFNNFPPNGTFGYDSSRLEFIDQDTLLIVDRPNADIGSQEAIDAATSAQDAQIRLVTRVSTNPGAATINPSNDEGGFNRGTTESWESTVLGVVNMDQEGLSEVVDIAYIDDAATGTKGIWIAESDPTGDQVSFFEVTGLGDGEVPAVAAKPFNVGDGTTTSFTLDEDPTIDSSSNDGDANGIHTNPLTGDIFVVESGFFNNPQEEPSVIIREVDSYDLDGKIDFGAWDHVQLTFDETVPDDDDFITESRRSVYDYVNNVMYFYDFDNSSEEGGGSFTFDWYALDLATGEVSFAALDADESTRGFGTEDRYEFFFLGQIDSGVPGDFNGDGEIDASDFDLLAADDDQMIDGIDLDGLLALAGSLLGDANLDGTTDAFDFALLAAAFNGAGGWAAGDFNLDGEVDAFDFSLLAANFNQSAAPTPLPEPASLALLGMGAAMLRRPRRA